jgi:hypothetical protein
VRGRVLCLTLGLWTTFTAVAFSIELDENAEELLIEQSPDVFCMWDATVARRAHLPHPHAAGAAGASGGADPTAAAASHALPRRAGSARRPAGGGDRDGGAERSAGLPAPRGGGADGAGRRRGTTGAGATATHSRRSLCLGHAAGAHLRGAAPGLRRPRAGQGQDPPARPPRRRLALTGRASRGGRRYHRRGAAGSPALNARRGRNARSRRTACQIHALLRCSALL